MHRYRVNINFGGRRRILRPEQVVDISDRDYRINHVVFDAIAEAGWATELPYPEQLHDDDDDDE